MNIETVLLECDGIVRARKNSRHRFVVDFDRRRPPVEALGAWALQKYHQVYLQNQIFSIIHAKSNDEDVRQFMVEQLIAEETPIECGSDSHYNLMRRFAQACGVGDDRFTEATAAPAIRGYVDTLLAIMREEHFAVALLAIYAIESQSGESVGKLLAALRRYECFSEAELEWFVVHADADDTHADQGLQLVRKYAAAAPDFETRAPLAVVRICDAWLALHDYYASLLDPRTHADPVPAVESAAPPHAVH